MPTTFFIVTQFEIVRVVFKKPIAEQPFIARIEDDGANLNKISAGDLAGYIRFILKKYPDRPSQIEKVMNLGEEVIIDLRD